MRTFKTRTGFSLIELLVVLAVIALLLAVLLPTLTGVRSSARTVACASSLRQVHMQFVMYANDNDGYWPVVTDMNAFPSTTWMYYLAPYDPALDVEKVPALYYGIGVGNSTGESVHWGCPEWQRRGSFTGYGMNDTPSEAVHSYPYDRAVIYSAGGGRTRGRFYKMVEWTRPTERALLADRWQHLGGGPGYWPFNTGEDPRPTVITPRDQRQDLDWIRHSGGSLPGVLDPSLNVLFVDGHVKKVSLVDAWKAHFMVDPRDIADPLPTTSW